MISKRKRVSKVDILFEVVGELIGAVFEMLCESKRVPRPVKVLIISIVLLPMAGLFIALAVQFRHHIAVVIAFSALTLLMLFAEIKVIRKIYRKN